ncbi:CLUMA_CG001362, isoform A [Clunio marinus]|uniref:CLUMA_CG001362, isoform A n=1 Tax=Clunio marinus TaxID=568069 RepID=A0A1J1HHT5_9DIPT|nr:CLUMA_CG001362, isoform A [Clunio marinus]
MESLHCLLRNLIRFNISKLFRMIKHYGKDSLIFSTSFSKRQSISKYKVISSGLIFKQQNEQRLTFEITEQQTKYCLSVNKVSCIELQLRVFCNECHPRQIASQQCLRLSILFDNLLFLRSTFGFYEFYKAS